MIINNINIDTKHYPHLLINGATRSGKTTLLKQIIADNNKEYRIAYLTPKPAQLLEFKDTINILSEENDITQLLDIVNSFKAKDCLVVIDELIYFMKSFKWLENELLKLLVTGAEFNNQLVLLTQRATYDALPSTFRANIYNVICLRTTRKVDGRIALNGKKVDTTKLELGEYYFSSNKVFEKMRYIKRNIYIADNDRRIFIPRDLINWRRDKNKEFIDEWIKKNNIRR